MKQILLDFVDLLRKAGIRVCLSETMDCLKGMECADLLDKAQFRSILEATLVKRSEDREEFDRLFHLYFETRSYPPDTRPPSDEIDPLMELVHSMLEQGDGLFSPEFRDMVMGGLAMMATQIVDTAREVQISRMSYPIQASYFIQRIKERLGLDQWKAQLDHLLRLLEAQGISMLELDHLRGLLEGRIQGLQAMIKDHVERETRIRMRFMGSRSFNEELMYKSFGALTPREIEAMRQAVKELVKRIKDEYSIRQRRKRLGRIDLKRTLRKSQQYGGVPMQIIQRRRKKSKARVIALCDVSSSVWNASRFMLNLLYSLQDQFGKVRSFIFVDKLGEVTEFFERYDIDAAIEKALNEAGIPYHHYTDYGSVFKEFYEKYLDIVNRKTTFIIIGDGRNNFFYPEEMILEKIRMKARRVIWLNPEPKGFWGLGDSMMHRYGRQCNEVRECRNLSQLMDFINSLVL
jgi:uncharacterized protein with von Willebrand factor type A (vWA) domain